jgi:hypothetical protein
MYYVHMYVLYNVHIVSIVIIFYNILYCASIFLDANVKDIDVLQKIQNKAMRTILRCDWYTHSKDMLKKFE